MTAQLPELPSKEQLFADIAHAEERAATLCGACADDHARLAYWLRTLLARMEQEPVAWIVDGGGAPKRVTLNPVLANADPLVEVTPLYAAPVVSQPAPVSVPECFQRLLKHAHGLSMGVDWNKGTSAGFHREKLLEAVKDCHAAMLNVGKS